MHSVRRRTDCVHTNGWLSELLTDRNFDPGGHCGLEFAEQIHFEHRALGSDRYVARPLIMSSELCSVNQAQHLKSTWRELSGSPQKYFAQIVRHARHAQVLSPATCGDSQLAYL